MTKRQAFSYVRVSSQGQVKGDGFARQRAAIRRWAKANRVEIVEEFQDEVSGTLADRSGLAALLDRVESNGVTRVIVERADRVGRDLLIAEIILGQFRDRGVKVIAADGGVDLTAGDANNPTGKLIRQVLAAVAEFDKDVTVLKLRAARDRKSRERGRRIEGCKPFGFYADEEATLTRMQDLYAARSGRRRHRGYAYIASVLNQEQRPTRMGGAWCRQSVWAILH